MKKILYINSVCGCGSTGKIVVEQARAEIAKGNQCIIAYGRKKINCDDIPTIKIGRRVDYLLHGLLSRITDRHGFYSIFATMSFLNKVKRYDPDIICIHNIHGYYINIKLLFKYIKKYNKKVRWTLHDCWSFTGHCAYFDYVNCNKWKTICDLCPQKNKYPKSLFFDSSKKNYIVKRALFTGIHKMEIITPSKWLAELVKESFLKEYPIEVIYNTVDRNIFQPRKSDFRYKYGVENNYIILGVANIWDDRKGLDDFIELRKKLSDKYTIVIVGVSKKQLQMLPKGIIGIQRTSNAVELAEIYSTADIFVNPTYEDNYPTVNIEAQACGTPVITYDTGGSGESALNYGKVCKKGDIEELKEIILQMLNRNEKETVGEEI